MTIAYLTIRYILFIIIRRGRWRYYLNNVSLCTLAIPSVILLDSPFHLRHIRCRGTPMKTHVWNRRLKVYVDVTSLTRQQTVMVCHCKRGRRIICGEHKPVPHSIYRNHFGCDLDFNMKWVRSHNNVQTHWHRQWSQFILFYTFKCCSQKFRWCK